jgi:hypothetical protein
MREPNESEMNDWLANLREDEASEPADTPSDADGELGGAPEATATVPETGGAMETSGPTEPCEAAEASGASWGPARDTGNGDGTFPLGAPVSAVADTTDFVDTDETAEPHGTAPSVTFEPVEPMQTGVTGETREAGQRDVAAEPSGVAESSAVTAGVSGPDETSGSAEAPAETSGSAEAPAETSGSAEAPAETSGSAEAGAGPGFARATWAGEGRPATGRRRRLAPGGRRPQAPIETPVRALIGDEMRTPTVWCELEPGNCISWHADREALGVADVRARAIAAGWRIDALGRLTCPPCQQRSAHFRTTQPVVLWSRAYALTMAAREAARRGGYQYPQPAFYPR